MKFRLDILLFSIIVFILNAVGLAFLFYGWLPSSLWLTLAYVVIWVLVFAFAIEFFVEKDRLSAKRFLLVTFSVVVVSATVMHSVWFIVTPRWSFSVSTDKPTYSLGENVTITVNLQNIGLITHSFKCDTSDPIVVRINHGHSPSVLWYSSYNREDMVFSLGPNQILQRNFLWNQTGYADHIDVIPGEYTIFAEIPNEDHPQGHIFWAKTYINITSA